MVLEIVLGSKAEVKKLIKQSKINKENSYLYNHIEKHKLAKTLIDYMASFSPFANVFKYLFSDKIKEIIEFISLPIGKYQQITILLNEFEKLNETKNNGFYVDNTNGNWKAPMEFSEEEYGALRERTLLIFEIFSPKIEHMLNVPDNYLELFGELYTS